MYDGEIYQLSAKIVAIETSGGTIIDLPEGARVTIADRAGDETCFVDVLWQEKVLSMLKSDLQERGRKAF
jgi:hypothetical protein